MKNDFKSLALIGMAIALVFTGCKEDDQPPVVTAQFEASSLAVSVDEAVSFTNYSLGGVSYKWSFGDGAVSEEKNPQHTYENGGKYTVKLIAKNGSVVDSVEKVVAVSEFAYVLNFGSYSGDKSTISLYDLLNNTITNGYYTNVNGTHMTSNMQYAYQHQDKVYFMGNNVDRISYVNASNFKQTTNGITQDVIKPRHCVGNGDVLYVSCWGGDIWMDESISYILKIDTKTDEVLGKIALEGGPEGLAIANGKLYAALNYSFKVAVIDLSTEAISYIDMPGVSTYFIKDASDNLYASVVSSYSDPTDSDGIVHINTQTNEIMAYPLKGISSSYVNVMAPNNDFSKIYVMTSGYDSNYNVSGAIAVFDVASKAFETAKFVDGVSGINGVAVNPLTNDVMCFISPSTSVNGSVVVYDENGSKLSEVGSGIAPQLLFSVAR